MKFGDFWDTHQACLSDADNKDQALTFPHRCREGVVFVELVRASFILRSDDLMRIARRGRSLRQAINKCTVASFAPSR